MAERFTVDEVCADTFAGFMLLAAASRMNDDPESPFAIEKNVQNGHLEVELRIGGQEYSMREFLERLEEAYDFRTTKRALQISKDKCYDILDRVSDFERKLERLIRSKFPEIHDDNY